MSVPSVHRQLILAEQDLRLSAESATARPSIKVAMSSPRDKIDDEGMDGGCAAATVTYAIHAAMIMGLPALLRMCVPIIVDDERRVFMCVLKLVSDLHILFDHIFGQAVS